MSKLQKIIFSLLLLFSIGITLPVLALNDPGEQADIEAQAAESAAARAQAAAEANARYNARVEAAAAEERAYKARSAAADAANAEEARGVAAAEAAANKTTSTPTAAADDTRNIPAGYESGAKTGIMGILPQCAFYNYGCSDPKDADINIFVQLGIKLAQLIFSIIGTVAFVMFVYGGFTMILSFGSSEKFSKGKDILVAAVVGMIIAFGAYLIVSFVLDVFQVGSDFRAVK